MDALNKYLIANVSAPDLDIKSGLAANQFYQEGGFARFFPGEVKPSQQQYIAAPQGMQRPQYFGMDPNSMRNATAAIASMASTFAQNKEMSLKREQMAMQQEQNAIDNAYKEKELAFRERVAQEDADFKSLTNSISMLDKFTNFKFIGTPENNEKYQEVLKSSGLSEVFNLMNDPNADMQQVHKLAASAGYKWAYDPRKIQMESEYNQWQSQLNAYQQLTPEQKALVNPEDVSRLVNGNILENGIRFMEGQMSDRQQSETRRIQAGADQAELNVEATRANIALTQQNFEKARLANQNSEWLEKYAQELEDEFGPTQAAIIRGFAKRPSNEFEFMYDEIYMNGGNPDEVFAALNRYAEYEAATATRKAQTKNPESTPGYYGVIPGSQTSQNPGGFVLAPTNGNSKALASNMFGGTASKPLAFNERMYHQWTPLQRGSDNEKSALKTELATRKNSLEFVAIDDFNDGNWESFIPQEMKNIATFTPQSFKFSQGAKVNKKYKVVNGQQVAELDSNGNQMYNVGQDVALVTGDLTFHTLTTDQVRKLEKIAKDHNLDLVPVATKGSGEANNPDLPGSSDPNERVYQLMPKTGNGFMTAVALSDLGFQRVPVGSVSSATSNTSNNTSSRNYTDSISQPLADKGFNLQFGTDNGQPIAITDYSPHAQSAISGLADRLMANGFYDLKLTGSRHHDSPDAFDIGLGSSQETNQPVLDMMQTPEGIAWALKHGYEVHFETRKNYSKTEFTNRYGEINYTPGLFFRTENGNRATAPHLHLQKFGNNKEFIGVSPTGSTYIYKRVPDGRGMYVYRDDGEQVYVNDAPLIASFDKVAPTIQAAQR